MCVSLSSRVCLCLSLYVYGSVCVVGIGGLDFVKHLKFGLRTGPQCTGGYGQPMPSMSNNPCKGSLNRPGGCEGLRPKNMNLAPIPSPKIVQNG